MDPDDPIIPKGNQAFSMLRILCFYNSKRSMAATIKITSQFQKTKFNI
jgi:hypothetical protein